MLLSHQPGLRARGSCGPSYSDSAAAGALASALTGRAQRRAPEESRSESWALPRLPSLAMPSTGHVLSEGPPDPVARAPTYNTHVCPNCSLSPSCEPAPSARL